LINDYSVSILLYSSPLTMICIMMMQTNNSKSGVCSRK